MWVSLKGKKEGEKSPRWNIGSKRGGRGGLSHVSAQEGSNHVLRGKTKAAMVTMSEGKKNKNPVFRELGRTLGAERV